MSALGAVETIAIGGGGVGGVGNSPGSAGGTSSFGGVVSAPGGDGGSAVEISGVALDAVSGVPGPGAGIGQFAQGGGGGGGAIRLSGTQGLAGAGGESRLGHGGYPRASEGPGTTTRGYGAGAGGSLSFGGNVAGLDGGKGIVIIELYG
ncbi:hypothetical protein ACFWVC_29620 [Streptomyces sp. NPDC058691]|uniref:hypothetical protein n=1 Tax=Streptomyces sp. NPDC058691 TaxID=3346601 RepID=UPI003649BC5D